MLIQVENKIKELKAVKSKEYYKQKDMDLENWGIAREGKGKKAPPIAVTDEEYESLIKASNGVGKTGRNKVAIRMSKAGSASLFICIAAAVVSLIVSESKSFIWFSLWIMAGFAFMGIFKGLAEAIRLLQQILDGGKDGIPEKAEATVPASQPPVPAFVPMQQPPVYPPYAPQGAPQAFYAPAPAPHITTVNVPNVTPVAPAAPAAPAKEAKQDDYSNMPSYDFDPHDDFFTKPYEPNGFPQA